MSLTHGGAALQVVTKLLAPIKQFQINSEKVVVEIELDTTLSLALQTYSMH